MKEKIKSIEIEAFRIYNELQIFDFETSDGEIADLVVIYAPNGYGKTSFFDAIEWSLTGTISRLNKISSIKKIVKKESGIILKNIHSTKEVGTVKITTDKENILHVSTKKLRAGTRKTTDLINGKIIEKSESFNQLDSNEYLASNMLSQDKIDSFLKFTSPKERYDVFKQFWDVENETNTYKKVLGTLSIGEKKQEEIENSIKQSRKELNQISNTNESLTDLNAVINIFNAENISRIPNVLIDSDEENNSIFIKMITEMQIDFENKLQNSNSEINIIENAIITKKNLNEINKTIEKKRLGINEKIDKRNQFYEYQKEKEEIKVHRNDINRSISELKIVKRIKEYISIDENYKKNIIKTKQLSEIDNSINTEEKFRLEQIKNINGQKSKLNLYNKNLESLNENLNDIYKLEKSFNENRIEKERFNRTKNRVKKINSKRFDEISKIEEEINIVKIWREFSIDELYDENSISPIFIRNEVTDFKKIVIKINELRNEIQKNLIFIKDYTEKSSIISNLINLGREVVKDSKTSNCPLCDTNFNNFENLLDSINSNIVNLDMIEGVEKQSDTLNEELVKLEEKKNAKYKLIKEIINQKINLLLNKKLTQNKNIEKNNQLLMKVKDKFELTTINLSNISNNLGIKVNDLEKISSISNFIKESNDDLNKKISKEIILIKEMKQKIDEGNLLLKKLEVKIQSKIHNFNLLSMEIRQLKEETVFKNFEKGKEKIGIGSDLDLDKLTMEINKKEHSILSLLKVRQDSRKKIIKKIYNTDKNIKNLNLLGINKEIEDINKNINELLNSIVLLNETLNLNLGEEDLSLEKIEIKLSEELNNRESLQKSYEDIKKIKSYIEVLNNNTIRNQKSKLLKQLLVEKSAIAKVNSDLKEVVTIGKEYISTKINKAFNVDSLNTIYQRIDPHPEFRIIKFEPSFPDNNPEIDMYAQSDDSKLSPVLYFSAAQLNLLSLSVFLARALENEQSQLNTIFMDDPVQHLDSINVLSFIDLLRSITLYNNRQVVISTHNESLFNLIKRKIDPEYTNSKYINLSSFGKVNN